MRRAHLFVLCTVALVVIACATPITRFPMRVQAYAVDFRPQTSDGFLFSPNPFLEPHQPLGLVTIEVRAEAELKTDSAQYYAAWRFKPIPVDTGLALAKARVRELGGDALVNLELRRSNEVISQYLQIPTLEVSGLAIKRGTR